MSVCLSNGAHLENHRSSDSTVKDEDEDKLTGPKYESDPESGSDVDISKKRVIVIDSHSLAGRDFNADKETPIRAIDLRNFTPKFDSAPPTKEELRNATNN